MCDTSTTDRAPSSSANEGISREQASRISLETALVILLLIVAAGTLLRLHHLEERSLYVDEAASLMFAQLPGTDFWRALWEYEGNMAFYYVLLRIWIHLGDSEVILRSLSVLFGVATILVTYLLGTRLFGKKAGLVSAALLAVNVYHIRYSQEARGYSLAALLAVLSTYLFLLSVDSPRQKRYWVAYLLTSALAVYSHLYALLVLIAQWLSLGLTRLRQMGRATVLWTAASLMALMMPMALFVLFKNKGQLNWLARPTLGSFLDFAGFLTGDGGNALLLSYAGLCLVAVFWPSLSEGPRSPDLDERWRVRLVALWLVFPIASTLLVSFVRPLFYDRYMVICVPAIVLLAGHGMTKLDRVFPRLHGHFALALIVMIGLSLWGLHRYNSTFPVRGDDWRLVTRYILARQQPGDAAFFYRASGSRPFTYYVHRRGVEEGATVSPTVVFPVDVNNPQKFNVEPSKEQAELATEGHKRVWLVLHHYEELQQREAAIVAIQAALQKNFRLSEQQTFSGATGVISVLLYIQDIDDRTTSHRLPSRVSPSF